MFAEIIQQLLEGVQPHDRVRLTLNSANLEREIWLPFMLPAQLTADRVMVEVERVLQSNQDWLLQGELHVTFIHAPLPAGGGRVNHISHLETYLKKKKCIITIPKSQDNTCCARAIVTAKARLDTHPKWEAIRHGLKIQTDLAKDLQQKAGIPIGTLCGKPEWDKFQMVLGNEYELIVVSRDFFNAIVYIGQTHGAKKVILYHAENHFSVITSMTAFMERHYYCSLCCTAYSNAGQHKCSFACSRCNDPTPCVFVSYRVCNDCHRVFVSDRCLQKHHANGLCRYLHCCTICGKTYHAYTTHKCGFAKCKQCKKLLPIDHKCYIQTLPPTAQTKGQLYIFYDFECMLSDERKHIPNLCVAHRVCQDCIETPVSQQGCSCGRSQMIFRGETTLNDFGTWLFSGVNEGAICLAHNAQAYDLYLIMEYVHKNGIKPNLIQNGKKILSMEAYGLKFIDSLNFFPMSLEKLPQAFGLTELAKGYFPHLFNIPANQNYVGPMPNIEFYDPDGMKPDKRKEFLKWYKTQTEFDFQQHLETYCVSDVDILQRCCGKFRALFIEYTNGVEPFLKPITIASACNEVFRTMFLKPDQIAIIPTHGYYGGNQSAIALCWLDYTAKQTNTHIRHAKNGGEVKVEGWLMDGVDEHGVLYSFHGCFWHGCTSCFPDGKTMNPVNHLTMDELRQRTRLQTEKLREKGFTVVEKWECEFKIDIGLDKDLAEFYQAYKVHEPLQPRDSFFGGRTNATRLFYDSHDAEQIRYVDFTSLYPYVCKYGKFPVGHPDVYYGKDITDNIFGILKCKIFAATKSISPCPAIPYKKQTDFSSL